jgi:chromosomal replication initiator protein
MKPQEIWQAALGELQLQVTKATYDTWVKNTELISHEDGTFIIGTQNTYAVDWLQNRLHTTIKRTLANLVGHSVEVRFVYWPRERHEEEQEVSLLNPPERPAAERPLGNGVGKYCQLNPRYTFDCFIVGNSNRLAHAASLAVAERPAEAYNPLFLYGGVGLGKTHLLQAIAHHDLQYNRRVTYISSETFTNDLINAIRNHTTEEFRNRYRQTDSLLVDDIQFIAGKESTQEEFFHTFNTLHSGGKQIVISSDRPPKAILTLEERLRSRFEWGLIADIQPPDLETRTAILRFKAESQVIAIPSDVLDFIAHQVQSNIRELEGALTRVVAHACLTHAPLTAQLAQQALRDLTERQENLSIERIITTVARFFNVEVVALKGKNRSRDIVFPRQVAMYLAREEAGASLPQIGQAMGGRDHTTVLHGCEKITKLVEEDDALRRQVLAIKEILYAESSQNVRVSSL